MLTPWANSHDKGVGTADTLIREVPKMVEVDSNQPARLVVSHVNGRGDRRVLLDRRDAVLCSCPRLVHLGGRDNLAVLSPKVEVELPGLCLANCEEWISHSEASFQLPDDSARAHILPTIAHNRRSFG